jgi:DNA primase
MKESMMTFSAELLDQIRAKMPISTIVGKRVDLRKQGREWTGASPFRKQKKPSFFVNDEKGLYFDFATSKQGDVFDFVAETEGLSRDAAIERLATAAGITLPDGDAQ